MLKKAFLLLRLAIGAGLCSLSVLTPVHAATYAFAFLGTDFFGGPDTATSSGILTTGMPNMGGFDVIGITGTYNGFPITLVDPATCLGSPLCSNLSPQSPDNILYFPDQPFLDSQGLVFSVAVSSTETDLVNLFFGGMDYFAAQCSLACENFIDGSFFEGSFTVTPIPPSLPMLGSVIVAAYLIDWWRRRRKFLLAGWTD
jgi:hypothetical protein